MVPQIRWDPVLIRESQASASTRSPGEAVA
jgi:hypothetical protein